MDVFWKKTRRAFCAGRDENMHQAVEPASGTAHTRRLRGEAASSDGATEALEGPVLGTHTQREWLLLHSLLCLAAQQPAVLCSLGAEGTSQNRPHPLLFSRDGC